VTVDRDIQAAPRASRRRRSRLAREGRHDRRARSTTGGSLALASAPASDRRYSKATLDEQRLRAVADGYEPGSTFKVVTIARRWQEVA